MLTKVYYLFGIANIIFSIAMAILSYRLKKQTENDKNNIKKMSQELETSLLKERKTRNDIEVISKLSACFQEIGGNLVQLNKSDDYLRNNGTSNEDVVAKIRIELDWINSNIYFFDEQEEGYNTDLFNDLLDEVLVSDSEAVKNGLVKQLRYINSKGQNILNKSQANIL